MPNTIPPSYLKRLKESRIKGNFTGGFVLYGYKIMDKKWTIDETQANIVRQMYKDYLSGMRLKDIADKLNHCKIKTNTGKKFTVNIISRLLHNEKYIGIVSAEEEYTNIVPAIVNKETFEEAPQQTSCRNEQSSSSLSVKR